MAVVMFAPRVSFKLSKEKSGILQDIFGKLGCTKESV